MKRNLSEAMRQRLTDILVVMFRMLVGVVFVVSGLSKAIDIYGFVYKIEEYLTVWGIFEPRSLIVLIAILLSGAEFVLGLMLFVGAFRRWGVSLLLLQMAVMLPLTLYIWINDPVSDCGCFGDFIKLSNSATFWKNVALTAMLGYLFVYNKKVKGIYHAYTQWMVAVVAGIYVLVVTLYGYNVQPLVDFRSFPIGRFLAADSTDDSSDDFVYVYSKDGLTKEFTLEALPDSSWTFVERHQQNGNESVTSRQTELILRDENGIVDNDDVFIEHGNQLLVVVPQWQRADIFDTYAINELQRHLSSTDGALVEIVSIPQEKISIWKERSMADLPVYSGEETVLKELSRGDMSVVCLEDGRIKWKRQLATIDVDRLVNGEITLDYYNIDGKKMLLVLSMLLFFSMLIIYVLDASRKLFRKQGAGKTVQSGTHET